MSPYSVYENKYPNCYTVHLFIRADNDKDAAKQQQEILEILRKHDVMITEDYLTDADDWAEHVHADDHPDAVRVGIGRRIVIDNSGNPVP